MPTIISTLSTDVSYTNYRAKSEKEGGANIALDSVLIKGGANVAQKHLIEAEDGNFYPGFATYVSEDELAVLEGNETFKTHRENGFIKIVKAEKVSVEKIAREVAKDMEAADQSAPLTEDDYKEGGRQAGAEAPTIDSEE